MDFEVEIKKLKELDLPKSAFVVVGSGALAIRGIRDSKDLDVVVKDNIWNALTKKFTPAKNDSGIETISITDKMEILSNGSVYVSSEVVPFDDIFIYADEIDGIKYINLDHLKKIKTWLGSEKDLRDVELISEYLRLKSLV